MRLLEMQQAMGAAVAGSGSAPSWIASADAESRMSVYRDTVRGVLTKALALNHPAVERLVGKEFFDGAAALYSTGHLPKAANLDGYGADFAEFLQSLPACADLRYLPDVARLDWAVAKALHAEDAAALPAHALIGAIGQADVCAFVPHPAVSLLACSYPADAIWSAVLGEDPDALQQVDLASGARWLLIDREELRPRVSSLSVDEWAFADALLTGTPLADALARADTDEAPQWLAHHLAAGRIVGWHIVKTEEIT